MLTYADVWHCQAADRMTRLAKLCSRWMGQHGFTFGVEDVMPTAEIKAAKAQAMAQANDKCAELIKQYKAGTLERVPGCDLELSLEQMIGKELDGITYVNVC
jgi:DNA-directed RNA polymerase III subunit RPC1